jgi:transcriptional regulator with AAA-type ATPase domain
MYMRFLSTTERRFLEAVTGLSSSNPFLPEHSAFERAALGQDFVEGEPVWSLPVDQPERPRANVWRIAGRLEILTTQLRDRLHAGVPAREGDLVLYGNAVERHLYQRFYQRFYDATFGAASSLPGRWQFYRDFLADWRHFFHPSLRLPSGHELLHDPRHTFACFRQIQRAFDQILRDIIGGSAAAARLRASVWQSIFTHDMLRYRRSLYARMGEFATLITGPSGTGKELAARAIAQSRYLAFDDRSLTFPGEEVALFYPINISALSPTLVESELFGHRRGSFTGAIADRKGWLETCPPQGSVFLDELGDLDPGIQVKLLRVIETRTFHPVGSTDSREFRGKLIAATNRDLAARSAQGEFREDLYYRLCSDQIMTPSLSEQIAGSDAALQEMIVYMTRRVAGAEAESLARDVSQWIDGNLGRDYAWPGNYRELEQCVKNVLIRRDYRPLRVTTPAPFDGIAGDLVADLAGGRLTADELLSRYCAVVYRRTQSYEETARRLDLDRRTVKSKVDRELLRKLA